MEKLRLGVIGLGMRGSDIALHVLLPMQEEQVEVTALCDLYADRVEETADEIEKKTGKRPFCTLDYQELIYKDFVDAVVVITSWETRVDAAVCAMQAGKPVGLEVGGAYSLEDCWRLVKTYEETGVPCMLLENCCYDKNELTVLNMVKQGLFGEVVYCSGGYMHDLRYEVAFGKENRHYRLRNYLNRNCDNYPTHELGPIAKVLNINNGNRMVSLTSSASGAKGLHRYITDHKPDDTELTGACFHQADIVKTEIKCANGELISLTLDTTLPRTYDRAFTVRGTKGGYFGTEEKVLLDVFQEKVGYEESVDIKKIEEWYDKYLHPLWKNYTLTDTHGGMDGIVYRAFADSVKSGLHPPIDVYDAAAWMCISALSEASIAAGGAPQAIPDFTRGKWMNRTDIDPQKYGLDKIYE